MYFGMKFNSNINSKYLNMLPISVKPTLNLLVNYKKATKDLAFIGLSFFKMDLLLEEIKRYWYSHKRDYFNFNLNYKNTCCLPCLIVLSFYIL